MSLKKAWDAKLGPQLGADQEKEAAWQAWIKKNYYDVSRLVSAVVDPEVGEVTQKRLVLALLAPSPEALPFFWPGSHRLYVWADNFPRPSGMRPSVVRFTLEAIKTLLLSPTDEYEQDIWWEKFTVCVAFLREALTSDDEEMVSLALAIALLPELLRSPHEFAGVDRSDHLWAFQQIVECPHVPDHVRIALDVAIQPVAAADPDRLRDYVTTAMNLLGNPSFIGTSGWWGTDSIRAIWSHVFTLAKANPKVYFPVTLANLAVLARLCPELRPDIAAFVASRMPPVESDWLLPFALGLITDQPAFGEVIAAYVQKQKERFAREEQDRTRVENQTRAELEQLP